MLLLARKKLEKLRTINNRNASIVALAVVYISGIIGLSIPSSRELFASTTPLSLVISAALLLWCHTDWNKPFWLFLGITSLVGYTVEVAGVHTEVIFGSYEYGDTLGWKMFRVPPMIGVNWMMLIYASGIIAEQLTAPRLVKSLVGAALMVLLDLVIEPVAIQLDFWHWESNEIPLQNYVAWYVIATVLLYVFYTLPFRKENEFAGYLYGFQVLFFGALLLCLS